MVKLFWAPALGVVLLLGTFVVASAHARYDHSTPGPGQVLPASPARVDIYTAQDMRKVANANVIAVTNAAGMPVDSGPTVVDDSNRRHFSVPLQPNLPPGRYLVSFKTLSDQDGEMNHGSFAFYVGTQPTAAQKASDTKLTLTADTVTPAQSSGSSSHTGLYLLAAVGVAIVLVGGVFVWSFLRTRPKAR